MTVPLLVPVDGQMNTVMVMMIMLLVVVVVVAMVVVVAVVAVVVVVVVVVVADDNCQNTADFSVFLERFVSVVLDREADLNKLCYVLNEDRSVQFVFHPLFHSMERVTQSSRKALPWG